VDVLTPTLVDPALRGMLLALLLLLAGTFMRDRPPSANRRIAVAIALGLGVQVVASTPLFDARLALAWRAPLIAVSVANGVLFWLLVRSLVDDEFVLRRRHAAIWGLVVAFVWLNLAVVVRGATPAAPFLLGLQQALPPIFAVLAAIAAVRHWRADLVEGRLWLRGFIVVSGVGFTLTMVLVRVASPQGRLSGLASSLDVVFPLIIVAVVASRLLRLSGSELLLPPAPAPAASPRAEIGSASGGSPAPAPVTPDPAEQRLADALRRAMVDERAYRTEDLTVAALAARLAVPEYRLRRLINRRLGHRNFNAFVNGFRLDEARDALADPRKRDLPILTIALGSGFQSIGPFNRAFKAATGLTPGEFRREKLADS
jgi:AraC-like DNA-binding protein